MKKLLLIMGVVLLHFDSLAQCANLNNIYLFIANGKRYELVRENRTWTQAASCGVARGGYLAHIESAAENTAIFNALSSSAAGITLSQTTASDGGNGSYVWLGGNDFIKEGAWIWDGDNQGIITWFWNGASNGSPAGSVFNRWGISSLGWQSEPDNFQDQGALGFALSSWPVGASFTLGVAGMRNDVDSANRLYYLIEYDAFCSETQSSTTESECDSYTSPSGKVWTTSGTYNDTVPNAAGCDSVMTFNLTIISVDNQVTKTKDTLSVAIGDAYQWLDCEYNYSIISGATNQTFVPTNDGEYAVEVTKTGCVDTSDCILVVLSSIVDINDNRVEIYPNPTTGYVQLEVQGGMPIESIKVYDMLCKEFEITYMKSQNSFKINLDELPSGNYMIVIQSQGNQIRRQVQKM